MQYEVKLFAMARQIAGRASATVELSEAPTVGELRRVLAQALPELAPILPRVLIAVDMDYADDAHPISPGAELAVIPPVSGGGGDGPVPTTLAARVAR